MPYPDDIPASQRVYLSDPATGKPLTALAGLKGSAAAVSGGMTLNAVGQRLVLPVTGMGAAMIHVAGTGVMTLKFSGTADADGIGPAGRRLWKAGVGSLGVSTININGAIDSEYRVVLGGQFMSVEVTSYTSGSVDVFGIADSNNPVVFVHGPVHTALDEAVRAGKAFSAGTGIQAVTAANYLNTKLVNPAGSGKNVFLFSRRFEAGVATGTTPLEHFAIANPAPAAALANALTPVNLRTGGATSVVGASWNMATSRLDSSPSTANPLGGFIGTGGAVTQIDVPRMIAPGQAFGHYIGGTGGVLTNAARLGITWLWYEEDEL